MRTSLVLFSLGACACLMSGQVLAQPSEVQTKVTQTQVQKGQTEGSTQWDALAKRLGAFKKLDATFTQTRWLGATGQTLTSTGSLALLQAGDFTWTQLTPFKQVVRLKDEAFSIQFEDEPAEVMTKATHPAVWAAAELLAGVMRLDVPTLTQHFTGTLNSEANGRWTATLEPKETHLKQLLGTVTVTGDDVVRMFRMVPNADNRTEITLSDVKVVR